MIKLTRLNHTALIVNSDLIEHIEMTPDTVISLTSGQKLIVLESAEEIVEKVIEFRKSIFARDLICPVAGVPRVGQPSESAPQEAPSHGR
jgi:flagellar protein FlbD